MALLQADTQASATTQHAKQISEVQSGLEEFAD
jgi:hypothetical protein